MMETKQDYDVIVLEEETTGWMRKVLLTHEDISYHATLFWNMGEGSGTQGTGMNLSSAIYLTQNGQKTTT